MQPVFRFAPSPNGELHLGHALSALIDYDLCSRMGGRFLLRIEDIDPQRSRPEFEDGILRDLAWLGITWEEPVRRQSEHMDAYASALNTLQEKDLIYPGFLSRREVSALTATPDWPHDPDGAPIYPPSDLERSNAEVDTLIAQGKPHTWRLNTARAVQSTGPLSWVADGAGPGVEAESVAADPLQWGDVMIARRDVPTSYHLAVVTDDALQGITHVVRGMDLFHATSVHVLLQALLGLPKPYYHHHRLIMGTDGRKLSKSEKSTSLRSLRDNGATPDDIRRMVGLPEASAPFQDDQP